MTRFLLGFAAGVLVLALVQYRFAPIPAPGNDSEAVDAGRRLSPERAPQADPSPAQSGPQGQDAGLSPRRLPVASGARSTGTAAEPAREPERETSEREPMLPDNPIVLPDSHAGFVDKSTPSLPDEHATLEGEDIDPDWAEPVEARIYSFVTSHPGGEQIQIVSLVCRTTRCEIAGSVFAEQGDELWNTVLSDMRTQPWFSSNFADSMFGSGGGYPGEFRFITIMARTGSEIAAPVPQ